MMYPVDPHPLKVEREMLGWSQAKLADTLGTMPRSVSRWEQGLAVPYPYYREQLCAIFSKTAEELGLLSNVNENDAEEEAVFYVTNPDSPVPLIQTTFLTDPAIPEAL